MPGRGPGRSIRNSAAAPAHDQYRQAAEPEASVRPGIDHRPGEPTWRTAARSVLFGLQPRSRMNPATSTGIVSASHAAAASVHAAMRAFPCTRTCRRWVFPRISMSTTGRDRLTLRRPDGGYQAEGTGMLIYSMITSLDGYTADADGKFDWAAPDEEVLAFINDLERGIGTHLYGRQMYEVMLYCETVSLEGPSPAGRDFAGIWRSADKIVYS